MNTQIKEYQELTTIQLFDGEVNTTASIDDLDNLLNNSKGFIRIGNEIINRNQIKRIFVRNIDGIENFILSQTKDIQNKLRDREKQKRERIGKGFENIEEIQNYINNNILISNP